MLSWSYILTPRLSQMILDQVFFGVLNEKDGTLEVFDGLPEEVRAVLRSR